MKEPKFMPPVLPDNQTDDRDHPAPRGDRASPSTSVSTKTEHSACILASTEEALEKFTEFVEEFTSTLLRHVRKDGTELQLAEDFIQTAHEKVWKRWVRTGELTTSLAYSRTVVDRVKIDYYRAHTNTMAIPTEILDDHPGADVTSGEDVKKNTKAFRQAVARLPLRQRQVVELRLYDRLEVAEIAERLQIGAPTVSNYWSIATKKIIAELRAKH